MSDNKIVVTVTISGEMEQPIFSFSPEEVTAQQQKTKVIYQLDKQNKLGLIFAGAIFPIQNQQPSTISQDITSFKIKDSGQQITVNDDNKNPGTIGLKLILADIHGHLFVTQDPQIKNEPK
jgi:hypothetical protein